DAVGIRPWIVHAIAVLPLGRAARAETPVARRGQHLAQSLRARVESLIGERKLLHRESSNRQWARFKPGSASNRCQTGRYSLSRVARESGIPQLMDPQTLRFMGARLPRVTRPERVRSIGASREWSLAISASPGARPFFRRCPRAARSFSA